MEQISNVSRAAAYWGREHQQPCHDWMSDPLIRAYINGHFDGNWPLDWFLKSPHGHRFHRALSIGCGTGSLERVLVQRDACERVDAFDASLQSIATARREAEAAGVGSHIRYFVADFNTPVLPLHTYDAIFFHQSLHHVERLESLLSAVLRTVKPSGLVFLDEYVGPSRIDWTRKLLRDATREHSQVPENFRVNAELLYPIQADDPSEAIRSGEILGQLAAGFQTAEFRGYGGNILALLYPEVRWEQAPEELLRHLVEADAAVAQRRGAYYAVIVARPRKGLSRLFAALWYASRATWLRHRWRRLTRPILLRVKLGVLRRLGYDARW
jgi:SAM-dependent methyltransferase